MITVSILINGKPVFTRSAVNVSKNTRENIINYYELDTGEKILHTPKRGIVPLAIAMLKTIKEPGEQRKV